MINAIMIMIADKKPVRSSSDENGRSSSKMVNELCTTKYVETVSQKGEVE